MPLGSSTREGREAGARAGRSGDRGGAGETRGSTAAQRRGVSRTGAREDVGGAFGTFAGEDPTTGRAEVARARDQRSAFAKVLDRLGTRLRSKLETAGEKLASPVGIGALAGLIVGGAPGARLGALGGSLFEDEEEKGSLTPTPQAAQTAAAPQQLTRSAPGVTPTAISAQEQFRSQQAALGGGDGRQVAAAPPVSRVSGIQPQVPVVDPRLQQQQFLAGGVLPTVDISAFPGALGRA